MVGRVFMGRYEVVRLLGEGGMGRVFLAFERKTGKEVVVKVLHDDLASQPRLQASFQQEMLFMARFRHPYAVQLLDASLNDPQGPCIVMEYVPGVTLESLLRKHRCFTPSRTGRLLGQLCLALQAAHDQGIIHRDLKPANLMVMNPDKPAERIRVMDFGLAKLGNALYIPVERLADPEQFFSACGTPEYICPEQARGDELDHRSDLYSVGVIVYEMLTGRVPFPPCDNPSETLRAHRDDRPPAFAQVGTTAVPPGIEEVVRSCLAKFPVERPQTARELAERYEKALGVRIYRPEEVPAATPLPGQVPTLAALARKAPIDPNAIVHSLEAWMPERIAVVKLKGFVDDVGGKVVESVPGMIRVRLGEPEPAPAPAASGLFKRLGFGRKPPEEPPPSHGVEMELRMEKKGATNESRLQITVVMRPTRGRSQAADPDWLRRCEDLHRNLRAYLMG
jgi:serine/threonine protein kinase